MMPMVYNPPKSSRQKQRLDYMAHKTTLFKATYHNTADYYTTQKTITQGPQPSPIGRSDYNHECHLEAQTMLSDQCTYTQDVHYKRPLPDPGLRVFGRWITSYDWRPVLDASGVHDNTESLYEILLEQLNRVLPAKWVECKSSDKS